jgi:hypothetical protein
MVLLFTGVGGEQAVVACVADAIAHLAGGGVGERDRNELAEADPLFAIGGWFQVRQVPFGEDVCLAAARACGEGDGHVAGVDGVALFGSKRHEENLIADFEFRIAGLASAATLNEHDTR